MYSIQHTPLQMRQARCMHRTNATARSSVWRSTTHSRQPLPPLPILHLTPHPFTWHRRSQSILKTARPRRTCCSNKKQKTPSSPTTQRWMNTSPATEPFEHACEWPIIQTVTVQFIIQGPSTHTTYKHLQDTWIENGTVPDTVQGLVQRLQSVHARTMERMTQNK